MTIESFQAFMARLAEDQSLRDELRSRGPSGLTFEELAAAATERGFSFTAADVTGSADGELSEDALEKVAGGSGGFSFDFGPQNFKFAVQKVLDSSNAYKLTTSVFKF